MRKLAIIGASDFQNPLILKAKEKGLETHVFAWESGDVGERTADHFYPISITEIDQIAEKCREIGVDGICTIGTDLGNITVAKVAAKLGLVANPVDAVARSTNKHLMRETFEACGDPSPRSREVRGVEEAESLDLEFPVIVKPTDRSGSRGITRLDGPEGLAEAVSEALDVSFEKAALVEEFVPGQEYSVEYVSWRGSHTFLALTKKYTTGAPGFIETGHIEPAPEPPETYDKVRSVVSHALTSLGVQYGASHSEVKVTPEGDVKIIEIGSRMGGDCIGSSLVPLSTGVDFVGAVVDVALGRKPDLTPRHAPAHAMCRFVFSQADVDVLDRVRSEHPEFLDFATPIESFDHAVTDSASRFGFYVLSAPTYEDLAPYLPVQGSQR